MPRQTSGRTRPQVDTTEGDVPVIELTQRDAAMPGGVPLAFSMTYIPNNAAFAPLNPKIPPLIGFRVRFSCVLNKIVKHNLREFSMQLHLGADSEVGTA